MMPCKQVATLLSTGDLAGSGVRTRLAVRFHLAMCRHCRAFKQQIDAIGRLAGRLSRQYDEEPAPDFEASVARRLRER
jgi:predicted anti-sigma-YlaC factor YlaD